MQRSIEDWWEKIISIPELGYYPDDKIALLILRQALEAKAEGNYGISACITDSQYRPIILTRNKVFYPYFSSGSHAEQIAIDELENEIGKLHPQRTDLSRLTLYSTLEPCPKCAIRFIASGIGTFKYLSYDDGGGSQELLSQLGENWQQAYKTQEQILEPADVHPQLEVIAFDIYYTNKAERRAKLANRRPFPSELFNSKRQKLQQYADSILPKKLTGRW